ncbi:NTPase [Lusitaniella coriacea LEGE 07157]|uniref:NTPase n=1 Tax=Lusitaniella coriacea LEGE 07157 TaxID=945747 RepID=A0A8J7DV13_9CYAN|nr:P-loop NTPase fold protein [Lusitaniella coriacea]MBE9115518.1 NTPase [Lusitaniella coriacea LEGE 07157]
MTENNQSVNSHIKEYLHYYCGLSHAPRFAILLKGQWGAGKTWFINEFCEKLKKENKKCLYISLYGMTKFSEVEYAFFQQLHPVLSSKGMAITGKVLKAFAKGMFEFDLNHDGKDDGTLSVQIPDINLPDYLKDADKSVLIFDDLERCQININNLLGYINYFVEHQGLKVILVTNEEELAKISDDYGNIKEKLIGKTFEVSLDFENALNCFITEIDNKSAKGILSKNVELIKDLYLQAEYKNLRALRQILLDFERIFKALPEQAKNIEELVRDILELLTVFSIEIKRGKMKSNGIMKLQDEYMALLKRRVDRSKGSNSNEQNENEEDAYLLEILDRWYTSIDVSQPLPNAAWWQAFFDRGSIDAEELEKSISNSKYFLDKNTPAWIKLYHFSELDDNEFENLLQEVELNYSKRSFSDFGIIKHIFGLFLSFSQAEIHGKSKKEILEDAKSYVDYLEDNNKLIDSAQFISLSRKSFFYNDNYFGLGFTRRDITEFKEFNDYIDRVWKNYRIKKMPEEALHLLDIMQNDLDKFRNMICLNSLHPIDQPQPCYDQTPVFNFLPAEEFIKKFIAIKPKSQKEVFWAISDRYKYDEINEKLLEELEWLKEIDVLLQHEISRREGKLSGFRFKKFNTWLEEAIANLSRTRDKIKQNTSNP